MAFRTRHSTREQPAITPEKKSHPLFWLLVLIAFLAIAWSLYNRYASQASAAVRSTAPTATPAPATRPATDRIVDRQPLRPARTSRPPRP